MAHRLLRELISEMVETHLEESDKKDHVSEYIDYMPHDEKRPSRKEIENHVKKHGGDSIKIKNVKHDGPAGGASEVKVHGHVKHVMKLLNHHHGDNYSHDHAGHKQYQKNYY